MNVDTVHHSYATALHQNGNLYTQTVPQKNIFPSNILAPVLKQIQRLPHYTQKVSQIPPNNLSSSNKQSQTAPLSNFLLSQTYHSNPLIQLVPPSSNYLLPLDKKNQPITSKSKLGFPTFAYNVKPRFQPPLQTARVLQAKTPKRNVPTLFKPGKPEIQKERPPFGFPKFEDFKVETQKPKIRQNFNPSFRVPLPKVQPIFNLQKPSLSKAVVPKM